VYRELITEVQRREGEDLNNVYAAGLNAVVGTVTARWSQGLAAPGGDARIENVHLHKDGKHVGFRFYLVTGVPLSMGRPAIEGT